MSAHLLKVKKLYPYSILPTRATDGSAGWDLYTCGYISFYIEPGGFHIIPLGIAIEIPEGYVGLICPRSGLAFENGVGIINSPGIVDSDYRGEIRALLVNHSPFPFETLPSQRIAQLLIVPIADTQILEVTELPPTTRGDRGFGSTGR